MLDNVSWGEVFVCAGLAVAMIGRKDIPSASKYLGFQVGRVVGLLQGARIRMDQFGASSTELKKLQNELKMGLRELDAVKAEMALAASSSGLVGRNIMRGGGLGTTGMERREGGGMTEMHPLASVERKSIATTVAGIAAVKGKTDQRESYNPATSDTDGTTLNNDNRSSADYMLHQYQIPLASRDHAVRAVAEEEWNKTGIGFKTRAELGTFGSWRTLGSEETATRSKTSSSSSSAPYSWSPSSDPKPSRQQHGASILNEVIQEGLIFDQYERTMIEQEELIQSRVAQKKRDRKNLKVNDDSYSTDNTVVEEFEMNNDYKREGDEVDSKLHSKKPSKKET